MTISHLVDAWFQLARPPRTITYTGSQPEIDALLAAIAASHPGEVVHEPQPAHAAGRYRGSFCGVAIYEDPDPAAGGFRGTSYGPRGEPLDLWKDARVGEPRRSRRRKLRLVHSSSGATTSGAPPSAASCLRLV